MIDFLKETTMIISPHPDDEVLGCGGLISKIRDKSNLHILYLTSNHPLFSKKDYDNERKKLIEHIGCSHKVFEKTENLTNRLQQVDICEIITFFEYNINLIKPKNIFVCYPSYNQDHRVVFDAITTAIRPHDTNWFVDNVFIYEQPETLHTQKPNQNFVPNFFIEIDIEDKIKLYNFYKSQIRGHRSFDTLKSLASLRGSYINKQHAEAFQVIRITNDN